MSEVIEEAKSLGDRNNVLLLYRIASDLGKHSLPDELVPIYLLGLQKLADIPTYYSYHWYGLPHFSDENPIRELELGNDLASYDGKNHFLTPKGVKYTEKLLATAPKTCEAMKEALPHLINIEHEMQYLWRLFS
jgi:hypothetical protein